MINHCSAFTSSAKLMGNCSLCLFIVSAIKPTAATAAPAAPAEGGAKGARTESRVKYKIPNL